MYGYVMDLEYRYDSGEFEEADPAPGFAEDVESWLRDGASPDE
jgi:hypothetical protein